MTLGAPSALWGFLAIPLLVLLYLLRTRRRDHPVSSLLLWRRCASLRSGYRPSRKIERSLLLILQILTVAALVAGLTRPTLVGRGIAGGAVVFVLETSFSMRARDVPPTRLARARAEALDLASHLRPGQKAGVVVTSPRAEVLVPLTDERQRILDALRQIDAWDTVGDVAGALTLAAAQPLGDDGRIVVWTDGAGGPLPDYPRVTYRLVGTSDDNVGITAFRTVRAARGSEALIRVENFSAQNRQVPLEVVRDDTVVHRAVLSLPAGGSHALAFPVPGSGILRARLGVHDMLPEDDEATAVVDASTLPSVLLVSPGNPYLETLLRLLPVSRAAETPVVDPSTWSAFGVVILDRIDPGPLPPGEYLLIGTVPSNLPIRAAASVLHPEIARWDRTDPVLRFVNFEDVRIARALTLIPQDGRVLAEGEVPLLWSYEAHGIRALVLGFALQDSTLPLHVAFPLLIANSLAWLGGGPAEVRAGDVLQVPAGQEMDAVLIDPDGHRETVRATDGMYLLPPFAHAGLYVLKTPTATRQFAVAVGSPKAGAIRPGRPPLVASSNEHPTASHAVAMRMTLWPWCLLGAVALAVGEWALVTRRRGGVA